MDRWAQIREIIQGWSAKKGWHAIRVVCDSAQPRNGPMRSSRGWRDRQEILIGSHPGYVCMYLYDRYIDLSIDSVPSTTATIIILKEEHWRSCHYFDNKVRLQSLTLQCEMTSSFVASGTTEHLPLWDLSSATPSTPAAVSNIPRK